ncbi:LOW QUALITY PROTEIN: CUB and sushi domain-containing protein 1-like [Pollicipes pollicipes]|uniref:LOW QUALITY PROTEIN: CUB and sushi domain-containing protein 1-like n=1 Tax=Pollicipes pollicipes TaxID=41117 RepID=UPI001884A0DF|nr:LOW QUALITY PROTEIN: CUB and sushi domain-containing protein 1-like [Pollicipes pollicipes]
MSVRDANRRGLVWLSVWSFLLAGDVAQGACPHPAVNLNSRVELSTKDLAENTIATYQCDAGFLQLGDASRLCSADDTWTGEPLTCATNVAQGKPSSQSSTARGGPPSNGNDGDRSTVHDGGKCTETLEQASPWWRVDLLDEYPIELIRITTRGCCGQKPLQDIEIRVGSSASLQQNRLCAWFPGTLEEGKDKDFRCARRMSGRYVFIQMVGVDGALSLCEVQVFSSQELAKEQCASDVPLDSLSLHNKTCYEFQLSSGANFLTARQQCQRSNGDLVHTMPEPAFNFLLDRLERSKTKMKTQLLWIGVRKGSGRGEWRWVDGSPVRKPRWGKDQPNSYVGQQNCVVLDGGRDWLWNDVSCKLDYLHWICEYRPQICGSPDKNENTTIVGGDFGLNRTISYQCPEGNKVVGDETRTCQEPGFWSGAAPTCEFVECGPLKDIANGQLTLLDGRTTYAARARYVCDANYTAVGEPLRTCGDGGAWSEEEPQCLFSLCPEPETPTNATLELRGNLTVGTEALFTCAAGHKLIGEAVATCQLGGAWSAPAPLCQLIDCGQPPEPQHGSSQMDATYYGATAGFSCEEDYWLMGSEERTCQEDGRWSGEDTFCELINCGEPDVPPGSYVTGYDFHVNSDVEYHCNVGHLLVGEPIRRCQRDGTWSGDVPLCQYVDCGRTLAVLHGDVQYVSGETHLDSELEYSCIRNYRLVGESMRVCQENGGWSGKAPVCEEVRCGDPERSENAVLSVSGNDRMRQKAKQIAQNLPPKETFRVGATVTYKCKPGYKVVGDALRSCRSSGAWAGLPPTCVYVDCGAPDPLPSGTVNLPLNASYYGAIAQYKCNTNFKMAGLGRRLCLENGTWSGQPPVCNEIVCGEPERPGEVLAVVTTGHRVGDTASYNCGKGRQLIGQATRTCLDTGFWGGVVPTCQWVDCGPLGPVENGRVYQVNQSTVYDSVVEYHCFPKYLRQGPFTRRCMEDGTWSGPDTKCLLSTETVSAGLDASLDGPENVPAAGYGPADYDSARNTAIWAGVAIGIFVLIGIVTAVVCLRMRAQVVKNTENVQGMKAMEERSAPIMSFANLADGPRFGVQNGSFSNGVAPMQNRPLPVRPDEEEIYAEADSFSSGPDSPPSSRTYANRDATYTNGVDRGDGSAAYNSGGDSNATYTNSGGDSSTPAGGSVTVNGMAL